jgi:hypothetical protein
MDLPLPTPPTPESEIYKPATSTSSFDLEEEAQGASPLQERALEARDRSRQSMIHDVGGQFQEALGTVCELRQPKAGLKVVAISELSEELEGVVEQIHAGASPKRPSRMSFLE